jgi:hypothetical protein
VPACLGPFRQIRTTRLWQTVHSVRATLRHKGTGVASHFTARSYNDTERTSCCDPAALSSPTPVMSRRWIGIEVGGAPLFSVYYCAALNYPVLDTVHQVVDIRLYSRDFWLRSLQPRRRAGVDKENGACPGLIDGLARSHAERVRRSSLAQHLIAKVNTEGSWQLCKTSTSA